jgi:hypothetical protein
MKPLLVLILVTAMTAMTAMTAEIPSVTTDRLSTTTFNKDVLPILQDNCQSCHRPGGVAPMSLMTYENVRPMAKAIKTAVVTKKMPPWFADPHVGEFRNAPKMTEADVQKVVAWVDSGAREGDAADKPASAAPWNDGWRIQPDVVVSMPEAYRIGAKGQGEVRGFIIPSPFAEDTWVSAIEIRPGDASVVHHAIVQVADAEQGAVFKERVVTSGAPGVAKAEVFFDVFRGNGGVGPNGGAYSNALTRFREQQTGRGAFTTMEAIYAPGTQPMDFAYAGSAKLIPGGKPLRLEMHYTPNGKETTDKTSVAFTLAKAPAESRFVIMAPEHLVDTRKPIPADEANFETTGELTFNQDANLVWFMPHMHLRGKDMTFRLIFPNGREETVLSARFDFHWQLGYELKQPIGIPRGTRMIVTAHHDNSASNPSNPAPGKPADWGEMTSQEMMLPWFGVVVDRNSTPDDIASYKPGDMDGPFPMQFQPAQPSGTLGAPTFQKLLLR